MATSSEPPEIHVTRTPSPIESARLRWVVKVDDFLDKESLDIMKLSFQSELTETRLERVTSPSDLYHALAERQYTDPDMQLSRFIYALEKLGHRRYGCRAIRRLEERYCPAPFDLAKLKVDMNHFILLQRLAVLCCMLPAEYNSGFSAFFASEKKADTNRNKYTTPCKIIKQCLNVHIITSENHLDMIEEALIQVGLTENQIQEYFDNFKQVAGFGCPRNSTTSDSSSTPDKYQPKKRVRGNHGPLSSSDRSTDSSSPVPRSTSSSAKISSSRETSSASPTSGVIHRHNLQTVSISGQPTETTPLLGDHNVTQRDPGAGAGENGHNVTGDNNVDRDQRPATIWNKKKKCLVGLCCITFLILLALTAGAAVLTGFAAKQYVSNKPTTQLYQENSSVILTQLNHFYTETLSVIEDTEHLEDFDHDIKVYQAETKCSDLVNETTYTIKGSNSSYSSTTYALAGSSIALHLCGSTNKTTHTDRLNIILLNQLEEPQTKEQPYKMNFFEPGLDGEMKCKDVMFDLPTTSYYTLRFRTPSTQMSFEFEITYAIQVIDSHLLAEHSIANHTLHSDQDQHKFTLNADMKYSCFVAVIKDTPNVKGRVHIQLHYDNRWAGLIAGVVVVAAMTLIFVTIIIALAVMRCFVH